jgi:hypothetical protein
MPPKNAKSISTAAQQVSEQSRSSGVLRRLGGLTQICDQSTEVHANVHARREASDVHEHVPERQEIHVLVQGARRHPRQSRAEIAAKVT